MKTAPWNQSPIGDFDRLASCRRIRFKDRRHHAHSRLYWPECLAVDRMSRDELLELQRARFQDLVDHAASQVPFYRAWAAAHAYRPGDTADISTLPVVTKADYMADTDAFQSDAFPVSELTQSRTSGSSGEPFRFRKHPRSSDYSYCCLWRALHRFGLRPGDRRVYVWGRSYTFANTPAGIAKKKIKLGVRNWLNNTLAIDAYDLTHASVHKAIDDIERFRPRYLHGYVSALYTIARTLRDEGRTLRTPGLVAAVTESEKLYDFQREAMEAAFGCPILEHYGSVEFGNIAEPDPYGNMRINEDMFLVERLPTGEAAITNLFSQAFPFIRYKLGDLIELRDDVPPPLPYACFRSIVGRTVDLVPIAAGGHVHGVALAHTIDPHLEHVLKYQIRQLALDRFTVSIIPRGILPDEVARTIAKDLRGLVGQDATVEITAVDHIEPAASGKFRWVVSDLTAPAQAGPGDHEKTPAP